MDCGLWTVDCGLRTVDCGLWSVDCGLWTVVSSWDCRAGKTVQGVHKTVVTGQADGKLVCNALHYNRVLDSAVQTNLVNLCSMQL